MRAVATIQILVIMVSAAAPVANKVSDALTASPTAV
jgi:hypothetical protein